MELKFDSISELEQFLMFSAHIGRAFAQAPIPAPESEPSPAQLAAHDETVAAVDESFTQKQNAINEEFVPETVAAQEEEAPRRKRRTKAEMEADRFAAQVKAAHAAGNAPAATAAAAQPDTSGTTSAVVAESASTPAGANPFAVASPATQAILEAPNHSAAVLAGMAAMQNPPVDEAPASPAPRVIESIEHLRACQSFIQVHGMTKYNESFREGLNANIAAYTPEQRAQHVAILEALAA